MKKTSKAIISGIAAAALILAFSGPSVLAKPKPGQQVNKAINQQGDSISDRVTDRVTDTVLVSAGISPSRAREIAVAQQLTGYKALPPGIQKNLLRGKPLPPGIARKMVPSGMVTRLPAHPGYEWRMAGSDLILVGVASGVVADVLRGVFK